MQEGNENILDILRRKEADAAHYIQRGLIIQPGALGDCILTLPLAQYMKTTLNLGGIDFMGHTESCEIFPARSCIEGIRSIDSFGLHRLFVDSREFKPDENDVLLAAFADYSWVASFLGEPHSNFEKNLIFALHCTHSAEAISLPLKPADGFKGHISDFYISQFAAESTHQAEAAKFEIQYPLIKAAATDVFRGGELLRSAGVDKSRKVVVIQPGSGSRKKCWHPENFIETAKILRAEGIEAFFLLGPVESDIFNEKELSGITAAAVCISELSLNEVVGVLACADCFIGNDSGITHLAAAMGVGTIAIFGATNPAVYKPLGEAVEVFKVGDEKLNTTNPLLQRQIAEKIRDRLGG